MSEDQPGSRQTTRVVAASRPGDAPEWALRQGLAIASRHISETSVRFALAADIAEALYNIAPPICGGRNTFGNQP